MTCDHTLFSVLYRCYKGHNLCFLSTSANENKTKIKFAILNCSFNDNVEAQIQKNQENENRPGYLKIPAENL